MRRSTWLLLTLATAADLSPLGAEDGAAPNGPDGPVATIVANLCLAAPEALLQLASADPAYQDHDGPRALPAYIAEKAKRRCEGALIEDAQKLAAIQETYAARGAVEAREYAGSDPKRFVVVFYGLLPREIKESLSRGENVASQISSFLHIVLPALAEHVLLPLMRSGAGVDVVGHTWEDLVEDSAAHDGPIDARLEEMIRQTLVRAASDAAKDTGTPAVQSMGSVRVHATRWNGGTSCLSTADRNRLPEFSPGAFCSTKLALRDVHEHEYAMVLLTRWDVVFYTPFEMHLLNTELFYLAHWCRATGPAHSSAHRARSLEPYGGCPDFLGAPDWIFTANPAMMHLFWDGFLEGLLEGAWRLPGFRESRNELMTCPGNHAFVLGRAVYLAEGGAIRLGRYKYHNMDFDFIRVSEGSMSEAYRPPSEINHSANRSQCYASLRPPNSIWLVDQRDLASPIPYHDARQPSAVSLCHARLHLFECSNTAKLEAFAIL